MDKSANFDHRGAGADGSEELAVRSTILLPVGDISDEHPGSHNVLESRTRFFQSAFNIQNRLHGLRVCVVRPNNVAFVVRCRATADDHSGSYAHCPAVAYEAFPFSIRGDVLALRHRLR